MTRLLPWRGVVALSMSALGLAAGSGQTLFNVADRADASPNGAHSTANGEALAELLRSAVWCRRSNMAVGFVLSHFDFDAGSFTRTDDYIADEGTVMRSVSSQGSWAIESPYAQDFSVHLHFRSISDSDMPKPDDEYWRRLDEATLQSLDGRKLHLQARDSREVICS